MNRESAAKNTGMLHTAMRRQAEPISDVPNGLERTFEACDKVLHE
jgi:hypothetical protein